MIFLERPSEFNPRFEVVSIFVICGDNILLLHRQDHKPQGGTWGIPAGKVDEDEKGKDYHDLLIREIRRELYEETGIHVKSEDIVYFQKVYVRYGDYDFVYHMASVDMPGQKQPIIVLNPEEHRAFIWVTPKNALRKDLIEDEDACIKLFFAV